VQFFVWGINKPEVKDQRTALIKSHWDFIAQYDDTLIARGPVMQAGDFTVVTGSIHIVNLKDQAAVETFVYDEPFSKAGLFSSVIVSRFDLELKRTQFEFTSKPNLSRFFVYCPAKGNHSEKKQTLAQAHEKYCKEFDDSFICHGSLLSDEGLWRGSVYFLEMENHALVEEFLRHEPYAEAKLFDKIEIHRWTMGGPENLNAAGTLS
jgi:uncharacterized protein YciI